MKRYLYFTTGIVLILSIIVATGASVLLDGQISAESEQIYPGVTATTYKLQKGFKYSSDGPQWIRTIEFDPKQKDLAVDVVFPYKNIGKLGTVSSMVKDFNATNTENKTVIAAINGDLWTMTEHQARLEGESSDPVLKKALYLPQGTNIVDGEIITSQHMEMETPYDEEFQSFGIAEDGTPLIGNLFTRLMIKNVTKGINANGNGLNRLPANNSLVIYTDKGPASNYCLDNAYEVVLDCDYDYTVRHGEVITATVTAISPQNSTRYSMQENRIILTARGSAIERISGFEVGDTVTLTVRLSDTYGNSTKWQTVKEAVGGHVVVLRNGVDVNQGQYRSDPMTLIGYKADGTVVMIVNDGRQSWHSVGINRTLFDELGKDLGLDTLFLLDGGGSTTLVELTKQGYKIKNRPSDYATIFTSGIERAVDNAVLLSYISDTKKYSVTWKNGNDTIYSENIESGLVPCFDNINYSIPSKENDDLYSYKFIGWSTVQDSFNAESICAIDRDTTYYAVYEKQSNVIAGDVNGDGRVNAVDINVLTKYIGGTILIDDYGLSAADVNRDGKISLVDTNILQKFCIGVVEL